MSQITQFLRRAVQIAGRGIATICGERQQDWTTFANRAARLAGGLAGLGFKPGDRIGILALNCDRYLESFFGLAWGGFVFVPINTRLAPPEIVFWLSDSGCSGLLVDDAFVSVLPKVLPGTPDMRHVVYIGDGPTPDGQLSYEALIAGAEPAVLALELAVDDGRPAVVADAEDECVACHAVRFIRTCLSWSRRRFQ